jgi:hypothetical protein
MARRLAILSAFLLSLASASCTKEVVVLLYNNSDVDLTVHLGLQQTQGSILIRPGEEAVMQLPKTPWIDFGMMAHRYETVQFRAVGFVKGNVVKIQAEADGRLYLVIPETSFPAAPLPKQPAGFPLLPVERTDLT